jgi:hypothetical protein
MTRYFYLEKEKPVTNEPHEQKGNVPNASLLETITHVTLFLC